MASPTMSTEWMPSRSIVRHTSSGSNRGSNTLRLPWKNCISVPTNAAPCMSGGVFIMIELTFGVLGVLRVEVLVRHLLLGEGVGAAGEREEDVLAAPHHTLGHARGAAGVDDDLVVARPFGEVTLGRAAPR